MKFGIFAVLMLCFAAFASATFIEKTLTTAGTEQALSTLSTTYQSGVPALASVFSNMSSTNQTAYNDTGLTTSGTSIVTLSYTPTSANATISVDSIGNGTGSKLAVYINGIWLGNITHNGAATDSWTKVGTTFVKGVNNVTIVQVGVMNLTNVTITTQTATPTATVYYLDASQNVRTLTLTLNGTTPVYSSTNVSYIAGVLLSAVTQGTVSVNNSASTIFTIASGSVTPTDNGGSPFCSTSGGCSINNMVYGGDALIKMRFNATSAAGVSRTVYTGWAAAGQMTTAGSGIIHWSYGERLSILGTPYTNNTNMSIYFEVS